MRNSTDIFDVVKGLSLLLAWNTAHRIARIDSLENTESTKVLERNLEHLETFGSSNEGSFQAGMVFLLLLAHTRKLALATSVRGEGRLDGLFLGLSFDTISHLE